MRHRPNEMPDLMCIYIFMMKMVLKLNAVCIEYQDMGLLGRSSSSSSLVAITVVLGLVLNAAVLCYGGESSTYRRALTESNIDMPVDSATFYVPPGENTPQQVFFSLSCLAACHFFLLSPSCFLISKVSNMR
jgi:hypothetical protein